MLAIINNIIYTCVFNNVTLDVINYEYHYNIIYLLVVLIY